MTLYNALSKVFRVEVGANVAHLICQQTAEFKAFAGEGRAFACHPESQESVNGLVFVQANYDKIIYTRQNFQLVFATEGQQVNVATNMLANDGYLVCASLELTERTWLLYRRNFAEFDVYRHGKILIIIARRKWHLDIEYESKIDFYKQEFVNHNRDYPLLEESKAVYVVRKGRRVPEFYTGKDLPDVTPFVQKSFVYGAEREDLNLPRPLMPASIGHLVQFIGMGALDNRELLLGDTGYLMRGVNVQETKGNSIINRTQFTIVSEDGTIQRLSTPMALADWVIENPFGLREAITDVMKPQYDMHIEPEWGNVYDTIKINGEELLKTQELAISAMIERLLRSNYGFLLGSPGVGKTICSITIMYVLHLFGLYKWHEPRLIESLCNRYGICAKFLKGLKAGSINIVYTPAILPQQWVNEFQKALGDSVVAKMVTKPSELYQLSHDAKLNPKVMYVAVMTYETLKLSDGVENAVIARHDTEAGAKNKRKPIRVEGQIARYATDPVTGLIVRDYQGNRTGIKRFQGKSSKRFYKGQYTSGEYIGLEFVRDGNGDVIRKDGVPELRVATRPITANHGHALWQVKHAKAGVVRDTDGKPVLGGTVFKKKGLTPTRPYKLAMCDAVKRLKNVGMVVVDEAHRIKSGDSMAGVAVRKTFSKAQKVLLVTATFSSGTADSFFHLVFPFSRELREKYPYRGEAQFAMEYGTIDQNGKVQAGITPHALRFIIDATVFVSEDDLGGVLPVLSEKIISAEMSSSQQELYDYATKQIEAYCAGIQGNSMPVMALKWWCQSTIADQCHLETIKYEHRQRKPNGEFEVLKTFEYEGLVDEVTPKELKLVELVMETLNRGERAIVFTTQSDTRSILERLSALLQGHGAKPFIIRSSAVSPLKRRDYIDSHVENGFNVLITNPKNIAEGVNLVAFTDIIYYDTDTSSNVMVQSSKRTRRPTQKKPKVTVYYMAYNNTPQVSRLMRVAQRSAFMRQLQGQLASEMDIEIGGDEGYGALGREFAKAVSPKDVQNAFDEGTATFGFSQSVYNIPYNRKVYKQHRPVITNEYLDDEGEES